MEAPCAQTPMETSRNRSPSLSHVLLRLDALNPSRLRVLSDQRCEDPVYLGSLLRILRKVATRREERLDLAGQIAQRTLCLRSVVFANALRHRRPDHRSRELDKLWEPCARDSPLRIVRSGSEVGQHEGDAQAQGLAAGPVPKVTGVRNQDRRAKDKFILPNPKESAQQVKRFCSHRRVRCRVLRSLKPHLKVVHRIAEHLVLIVEAEPE